MFSTLLHLRIPFSYFLLPVYLFALGISPNFTESRLLWSFVIIHLLLYPASNGYNSYFDKDEKSIGGLKNPPPVNKSLYYTSLLFDAAAMVLAFLKISLLSFNSFFHWPRLGLFFILIATFLPITVLRSCTHWRL